MKGMLGKATMVKKILLLSLSLIILGVVDHEVIAASLPNRESVEFLESKGHNYAFINFSSEKCKVSVRAARQAILYSCFAIVYPGGKVGSLIYMLKSADVGVKDSVRCPLSANKNQATLFQARFSDNLPRAGLGAFATYAMARSVREEGNTYYADIAFPA
nr:hypothetical protein [Synechococcus sp. AH-551-E11]